MTEEPVGLDNLGRARSGVGLSCGGAGVGGVDGVVCDT
jgi:hypothetical protein